MRSLIATALLIFSLNTWAQHSEVKPPSNPEPGVQVRQEFLRAYNAKDTDAVVALYAEDATLVSDGGIARNRRCQPICFVSSTVSNNFSSACYSRREYQTAII